MDEIHLRAICEGCGTATCGPADLTRERVRDHEKVGCGPIKLVEIEHGKKSPRKPTEKAYGNH